MIKEAKTVVKDQGRRVLKSNIKRLGFFFLSFEIRVATYSTFYI